MPFTRACTSEWGAACCVSLCIGAGVMSPLRRWLMPWSGCFSSIFSTDLSSVNLWSQFTMEVKENENPRELRALRVSVVKQDLLDQKPIPPAAQIAFGDSHFAEPG